MDRRIVSDAPVRPRPRRFLDRPPDRIGMARQNAPESWPPGLLRSQATARFAATASGVRRPVTRAQRMQVLQSTSTAACGRDRDPPGVLREPRRYEHVQFDVVGARHHAHVARRSGASAGAECRRHRVDHHGHRRSHRAILAGGDAPLSGKRLSDRVRGSLGEVVRRPEGGRRRHGSLRTIRRGASAARCGAQRPARRDRGRAEGRQRSR